jgi:hypothetical protein
MNDDETEGLRQEALDDPFPREPYALFPTGGYSGPEGVDFLIHKEISNEAQCVLLFDSIVDAFTVAEEYKTATGKEAEPRPVNYREIEERFWVKFYRANGTIIMCPIEDYARRVG